MSAFTRRRDFLAAAAAAGAASAVAYPASDTVNVGCIGTGGRCRGLMRALSGVPGTKITAVCDIWDDALDQAKSLADPQASATKDYERLLARSDVDAVIIGSPDHWHVPMTVDACEAGKDVFVEKPLTHDLSEGESVVRAQDDYGRIVQVGTQQRSMPQFEKAREILRAGKLGTVHKVHMTWNRNRTVGPPRSYDIDPTSVDWERFLGNAPSQPFDPFRFRNWRWFWDFGGGILTDLMVHWIDAVYWLLDLPDPAVATTIGDTFGFDRWETPDTIQTLLQFPDRELQVYFEGTFVNQRNKAMIEIMGTRGTMYLDRGRYEIYPEPESGLSPEDFSPGTRERGADFDVDGETPHLQNWIDSVRTRKKPVNPAESGVKACVAAHMANLAFRTGQVARLDDLKSGGLAV